MHVGPDAHTVINTANGTIIQVNIYRDIVIEDDHFTITSTDVTLFAIGADKSSVSNNGTILKIDIYGGELSSMESVLDFAVTRRTNYEYGLVIRIKCWNR